MSGRRRGALGLALACSVLALACEEPSFRFSASFPGPVDVEEGADVRYQGVPVGEVEGVELYQAVPEEPARVIFRIAIYDPSITIRRDDVIELASGGLLEDDYLHISAAPERSSPLDPGATLVGTPPLSTRIGSAAGSAYDSVAEFLRAQAEYFQIPVGSDTRGMTGPVGPRDGPRSPGPP